MRCEDKSGKWKDVLEGPGSDGKEKLLVAVATEKEDEIRRLLESRVDPSAEALVVAARRDESKGLAIVKLLLEKRAAPSDPDRYGCRPLVVAAAKGHLELVCHLLECQARPDPETKTCPTALHAAASFANIDRKTFEVKTKEDEAAKEKAKEKAKEEKAKEFLKVAKVLLQKRADPNVSLEWEGHQSTCMLAAASSKAPDSSALDMIHLLLMQRADPKATTEGRTVLSVADAEGNRAEYLLDRLLRGEGQEYTDLVQNLLQEARDTEDDTRQQRLREPVRTILGRDQKARP